MAAREGWASPERGGAAGSGTKARAARIDGIKVSRMKPPMVATFCAPSAGAPSRAPTRSRIAGSTSTSSSPSAVVTWKKVWTLLRAWYWPEISPAQADTGICTAAQAR